MHTRISNVSHLCTPPRAANYAPAWRIMYKITAGEHAPKHPAQPNRLRYAHTRLLQVWLHDKTRLREIYFGLCEPPRAFTTASAFFFLLRDGPRRQHAPGLPQCERRVRDGRLRGHRLPSVVPGLHPPYLCATRRDGHGTADSLVCRARDTAKWSIDVGWADAAPTPGRSSASK